MIELVPWQNIVLHCGKFRNRPIGEVPEKYLLWMVRDRHQQAYLAERELKRRDRAAAAGKIKR